MYPLSMALTAPPGNRSSPECSRLLLHLVGQVLDIIGAGQRVDHVSQAGFHSQDPWSVVGDLSRPFGIESQRLVVGYGITATHASAQKRGHALDRCPDDVVQGLLDREGMGGVSEG